MVKQPTANATSSSSSHKASAATTMNASSASTTKVSRGYWREIALVSVLVNVVALLPRAFPSNMNTITTTTKLSNENPTALRGIHHQKEVAATAQALNNTVTDLTNQLRVMTKTVQEQKERLEAQPVEAAAAALVVPATPTVTTSTPVDPIRMAKYTDTYHYQLPTARTILPESHPPDAALGSECGAGPDYAEFFTQPQALRSRLNEDKIIYERFFKGKLPAAAAALPLTYIELGAFDGMTESNSRFFDVCLGWEGLLMEGNPSKFPLLCTNRPNAHKLEFAPSCSAEYEAMNHTVSFHNAHWTNAGMDGKALAYNGRPTVQVPCGPLGPVLEDILMQKGRTSINFFSLDVEGAETMVLKTIDFAKVQIDVLMIEVKNSFCQDDTCVARQEIRAIMEAAGYQRHETIVQASDVYVHPNSVYQL